MARLDDMEELIFKVENKSFKPTLHEIISCYYAGAYRACIILSFNILVDDLVEKIEELKDTNKDLKEIHAQIIIKNKESTPIENYLIESLVSKNLIENLDGDLYTIFQKLRHKSAHPTGFIPSAECARYVFSEIINRFLSKKVLKTTSRIDEIIESLKEGHFFAGNKVNEVSITVSKEISNISPTAYPQLINRMYKSYEIHEDKPNNPYLRFILGLAYLNNEELNTFLLSLIIDKQSKSGDNKVLFISLLSCSPKLFDSIHSAIASRILLKIKESIKDEKLVNKRFNILANPFLAIIEVLNSTNGELAEKIKNDIEIIFTSHKSLTFFVSKIDMSNNQSSKDAYLNVYKKILSKIKKKDVSIIIESIENDDSGAYARMSGFKLHTIISEIIKAYGNETEKTAEFLNMINVNHKDIINRINGYTEHPETTMNKIKHNNKTISDETLSIMKYTLGIKYPSDSE